MGTTKPKKILIVSYYWPPAGGPGVQRWLKFVKYLPDFGVNPFVYIPKNASYPIVDNDLIHDVNPKTTVVSKSIFEPYGLASFLSKNKTQQISSGIIPTKNKQSFIDKILIWIRGNAFIPDARKYWVQPSVRFLEKYLIENEIDTIITTGPPHSLHLIGLQLKDKLNLTWHADFRDPWTTIGYHKSLKLTPYAANKHKQLERKVLTNADSIIVTSPTTKITFEQITQKPIAVITNGFDHENIEAQKLDTKFTLAHIGSLLSDRNPFILWECLSELNSEIENFDKTLEIKLIGKVSQDLLNSISNFNLSKNTKLLGYVTHNEALIEQRKSQVLLLIEIDSLDTACIIPGKLFEYIYAKRPIIAIGPKQSDIKSILTQTSSGSYFDYQQKELLKQHIRLSYYQYLNSNLTIENQNIEAYSRKNLTRQLSEWLLNFERKN
jgi:hypothetical protein